MDRKSFSLVELLVAIAISTLILGSLYIVHEKVKGFNESLGVRADLLTNGRAAMHQLIVDLPETNRNTLTKDINGLIPSFTDPLNNETHQILIFASARGDPGIASEDGAHSNNNYAHLDTNNRPSWRSIIIYCTYVTSAGLQQLRRYVDYGSSTTYYSQPGILPLALGSITSTHINLTRGDSSTLSISRNTGKVVANYITTEDTNQNSILDANENDGNNNMPPDNQDGILDRGADFNISGGLVKIKLFLTKPETSLTQGKRYLVITISDSTVMRN